MRRIAGLTAAVALLGGIAAAGTAAAQMGPMGSMGPMGGHGPGRSGLDFAAIDSDGNGSLSRAELEARAVARMAKADANGDGTLDRDEIIVALGGGRGGLFEVFSVDPAEARADRLLALMGATEAGRVEVAALAAQRVNLLLAFADTDRDAAISQTEADAMRARMRDGRGRGHGWHHGGPERSGMAPRPDGRGPDGPGPDAPPVPPAPRG